MCTLARRKLWVRPLNQALLLITSVCFGYGCMALRGASVQTNPRYLRADTGLPLNRIDKALLSPDRLIVSLCTRATGSNFSFLPECNLAPFTPQIFCLGLLCGLSTCLHVELCVGLRLAVAPTDTKNVTNNSNSLESWHWGKSYRLRYITQPQSLISALTWYALAERIGCQSAFKYWLSMCVM